MDDAENEGGVLLVTEVAQRLRLSVAATYSLIGRGELPHIRLGRAIRVPERALERWIQEAIQASNPEANDDHRR